MVFLSAGLVLLLSPGCTTNPATGDRQFTGFVSSADEAQLGRSEHSKIFAQYGEPYADPKLADWVTGIGLALARQAGRPDIHFTFTVLDTGTVNAFSTPGGYVYVSRGLLTLANTEGEVAAVLGHEMGHIIARHQTERYSLAQLAEIGVPPLGAMTGSGDLARLTGSGSIYDLAGFSRDQEYQADAMGVRMIAAAGYDPDALASFLTTLGRDAALEAPGAGEAAGVNFPTTHPLTADRLERAKAAAIAGRRVDGVKVGRDAYLRAIDGVVYGDSPDQGLVRGSSFIHPKAGFTFEAPQGFHLRTSPSAVVATRDDGAMIVLTSASPKTAATPLDYLTRVWAISATLEAAEPITIAGRPSAIGIVRANSDFGPVDVRLVAIGWSPFVVYRLMFVTPPNVTPLLAGDFERTAYSFRALGPGEAARYQPYRVRIVTAKKGDTTALLARYMAPDRFGEAYLRVFNALDTGAVLHPGEQLKVVEK